MCCHTLLGGATVELTVVAVPPELRTTNRYLPPVPAGFMSRSYCSPPLPVPLAISPTPAGCGNGNLTHAASVKVKPTLKFKAGASGNLIYWLVMGAILRNSPLVIQPLVHC